MRRQAPVPALLYNFLYPRPSSSDPPNFSGHLARFLIPEIRVETNLFFGNLDTIEARYPGLNYTYGPHIRRLCRYPHHNRLFRAFRLLGVTDTEILDLARWEGTLWARQRYEKDEGIKILDTTGDEIKPWVDPRRTDISKVSKPIDIPFANKDAVVSSTAIINGHSPVTEDALHCDFEVRDPELTIRVESPLPMAEDEVLPSRASADATVDGPLLEETSDATAGAMALVADGVFEGATDTLNLTSDSGIQRSTRHVPQATERVLRDLEASLQRGTNREVPLTAGERETIEQIISTLRHHEALPMFLSAEGRAYIARRIEQMQDFLPHPLAERIVRSLNAVLSEQLQFSDRRSQASVPQIQGPQAIPQPAA